MGAKAYRERGDKTHLERWLDRALAAFPDNATSQRGKNDFHRDRQEWPQVPSACARAAELRPDVAGFQRCIDRPFLLLQRTGMGMGMGMGMGNDGALRNSEFNELSRKNRDYAPRLHASVGAGQDGGGQTPPE